MPLTIVVADDGLDFRLIVRYLLAPAADMKIVGEAADGEEALAVVLRERPDLVITDLFMPHLNGIELTRRIQRETAAHQDHPHEFPHRRRLPAPGLRQRARCLREQAGDQRQPAARNPRRDPPVRRRERAASARRGWIIGFDGAPNVMTTFNQ